MNQDHHSWRILSDDKAFVRVNADICTHENRYVFIAGGRDHSRSVVVLDTKTGVIKNLIGLPQPYHKCSITVAGKYLYIISCFEDRPIYRKLICRANQSIEEPWEEVKGEGQLPQYRTLMSDGQHLFSFGHRGNAIYNTSTECWLSLPFMKKITFIFATVRLKQKLVVIGGYTNDYYFDRNNLIGEIWDNGSSKWHVLPGFILDLENVDAASFKNRWIIVTGKETGKSTFSFYIYDTKYEVLKKSPFSCTFETEHVLTTIVEESLIIIGNLSATTTVKSIPLAYIFSNWIIIEHLITLRSMVEKNRVIVNEESLNLNALVRNLMINVDQDMFREIVSFLIPSLKYRRKE